MDRLPFDPARLQRPADAAAWPEAVPPLLSVRQVNELVRGAILRHLPPTVHVLGEIGNLSRPVSGHLYFTLKDASSELRCVLWRSAALHLKFAPEVGMQVIATGSIEVYAQRGAFQLVVRKLEPRGVGALEVAFRQLKERLERDGLFDPRRKKSLPRIPERVAIVTSPTGAAIRDMLHTLGRRFPAVEVLIFPVRVQGEGAAQEIAAAIRTANEHALTLGGIDLLIVGRGGGSLEDLWAFNEEVVARAIAASRIPVVSAVGHEVDVTISDLVADLRAPTPTAAAELIAPTLQELADAVAAAGRRTGRAVTHAVTLARARLDQTLAYDGLARPLLRLHQYGQLADELAQRLRLAAGQVLRQRRAGLDTAELALLRYGTGMRFAQSGRALEQRLRCLLHALDRGALEAERRLRHSLARLEKVSPTADLKALAEHVQQAGVRMLVATRGLLVHRAGLLEARLRAVAAYHPHQVLKRGYSLTRDARTRRLIRSINQVRDRLRIVTELADGEFHAVTEDPRQPKLFD